MELAKVDRKPPFPMERVNLSLVNVDTNLTPHVKSGI